MAIKIIESIKNGCFDSIFEKLYLKENVMAQRERYIDAVNEFIDLYGEKDELLFFSAPGRTEIGGNHTDHNNGCVLAGSVNLDVIAVVALNSDNTVRVKSRGYRQDVIDLDDLEMKPIEDNKAISLIRGTLAKFVTEGYKIGGFDAYTTSNVLKGSGLSSSAAFEVLIGTILNGAFNGGSISPVKIAQIAQWAENNYFGKPCGLMDQMASSVGGVIAIDFADKNEPKIEQVDLDLQKFGYALCIVDVGGNHASLTDEYASIPGEMKSVASLFSKDVLRGLTYNDLLEKMPQIREKYGDRALLRAVHFIGDNDRVGKELKAVQNGDFETFKELVIESGNSSFMYLQNIYANKNYAHQEMSVALMMSEKLLSGKGAWRVHGGGFGGTTQNFVPLDMVDEFKATMESVFGEGSCHVLSIRPIGGTQIK